MRLKEQNKAKPPRPLKRKLHLSRKEVWSYEISLPRIIVRDPKGITYFINELDYYKEFYTDDQIKDWYDWARDTLWDKGNMCDHWLFITPGRLKRYIKKYIKKLPTN